MKKALIWEIKNSIVMVMETMFSFSVKEKAHQGSDLFRSLDPDTLKACCISFTGTCAGVVFLIISMAVLTRITRNVLGEGNASSSDLHTNGTLLEALNMISGDALTHMDAQLYMRLGIPELIDPAALRPDDSLVLFDAEDGLIAAYVVLEA